MNRNGVAAEDNDDQDVVSFMIGLPGLPFETEAGIARDDVHVCRRITQEDEVLPRQMNLRRVYLEKTEGIARPATLTPPPRVPPLTSRRLLLHNRPMNLLLHICCGPCSLYPIKKLRMDGVDVTGFFYNHNIHPYQEYQRRLDGVRQMAEATGTTVLYRDEYDLEGFLAAVAANPVERCHYCYFSRLDATAARAAELGCDAFSSTLLYSRYQNHAHIVAAAERAAQRHGVRFFHEDFRPGWQEGIRLSKEMGLYRQQYCGCIYSEKDRYYPAAKRG